MGHREFEQIAHLMRRAGFGATHSELEAYSARGYEATVEELLNPGTPRRMGDDLVRRYHHEQSGMMGMTGVGASWLYRMITTTAPLEEKMSLFWHNVFATGITKTTNGKVNSDQIRMFRHYGMGSFETLLMELSRNPAMIGWLDNNDNHNGSINENYGRELLELFSMGVGNYTEDDVKECARAFTGWTIANTDYMILRVLRNSIWPYGCIDWHFEYRPEDHDEGEKVFLGHRGKFNGENVIEIICRQPATARFISRHLYHFFVADEPPVPQWPYTPPRDPEAIEELSQAYFESHYDIRSVLRMLLNSDFFRSEKSRYEKVKGPAELVAGVLRLTGEFQRPQRKVLERVGQMTFMGQQLINPPSVEGWHQGTEWIDPGRLMERLNFAAEQLGNPNNLGVKDQKGRVLSNGGGVISPEGLADSCLEQMGAISVSGDTRALLVEFASRAGELRMGDPEPDEESQQRVAEMLRLVAATPEFQRL